MVKKFVTSLELSPICKSGQSAGQRAALAEKLVVSVCNIVKARLSTSINTSAWRRELHDYAHDAANALKWATSATHADLLADDGGIDVERFKALVEVYRARRAANAELFDIITLHHAALQGDGDAYETGTRNTKSLQTYAAAAVAMGQMDWVQAGLAWMEHAALDFFAAGGAKRVYVREQRRALHEAHGGAADVQGLGAELAGDLTDGGARKLAFLDIGSCYNPFAARAEFEVTACDLYPKHRDVLQCDFLEVQRRPRGAAPEVTAGAEKAGAQRLVALPEDSYDVAALSLVLSYLPSPAHRIKMLETARALLVQPETDGRAPHEAGLLLIVEKASVLGSGPRGQRLLRHWKRTIQALGFKSVTYRALGNSRSGCRMHAFCFRVSATEPAGAEALWIRSEVAGQDDVSFLGD